jgi:hypothetical protein
MIGEVNKTPSTLSFLVFEIRSPKHNLNVCADADANNVWKREGQREGARVVIFASSSLLGLLG